MDSLDIIDTPPSPSSEDSPHGPESEEGVQLHYNSKTGVMTSMEGNDAAIDLVEKKKRNRFSLRGRLGRDKSVPSSPPSTKQSTSFHYSSIAESSRIRYDQFNEGGLCDSRSILLINRHCLQNRSYRPWPPSPPSISGPRVTSGGFHGPRCSGLPLSQSFNASRCFMTKFIPWTWRYE